MRLATFNILNGRPLDDNQVDVDRFAKTVQDLGADVLALQEVDQNQRRSGYSDLTSVAADVMGAVEQRFVPALCGTPGGTWTPCTGDERPRGPACGISFVSRYPILDWEVVRLPPVPAPAPMAWPGNRRPVMVRDEPRVALVSPLDTPYGEITVVSTHLSFLPWWNRWQLRVLTWSLQDRALPMVVMGDLNMAPEPAARITGMRPLATGLTFPVDEPIRQIDHILASGELPSTTAAQVHRMSVSDHRALSVDLD